MSTPLNLKIMQNDFNEAVKRMKKILRDTQEIPALGKFGSEYARGLERVEEAAAALREQGEKQHPDIIEKKASGGGYVTPLLTNEEIKLILAEYHRFGRFKGADSRKSYLTQMCNILRGIAELKGEEDVHSYARALQCMDVDTVKRVFLSRVASNTKQANPCRDKTKTFSVDERAEKDVDLARGWVLKSIRALSNLTKLAPELAAQLPFNERAGETLEELEGIFINAGDGLFVGAVKECKDIRAQASPAGTASASPVHGASPLLPAEDPSTEPVC